MDTKLLLFFCSPSLNMIIGCVLTKSDVATWVNQQWHSRQCCAVPLLSKAKLCFYGGFFETVSESLTSVKHIEQHKSRSIDWSFRIRCVSNMKIIKPTFCLPRQVDQHYTSWFTKWFTKWCEFQKLVICLECRVQTYQISKFYFSCRSTNCFTSQTHLFLPQNIVDFRVTLDLLWMPP